MSEIPKGSRRMKNPSKSGKKTTISEQKLEQQIHTDVIDLATSASSTDPIGSTYVEGAYVFHDLSHCAICKGREDEDMILLCDGCDLEIHMYCLKPIITEVPEGAWYCPACDPDGTTTVLERYLHSHTASRIDFMKSNKLPYREWLAVQQHNLLPLPLWSPFLLPAFSASQLPLVPPKFDSSSESLIGCSVRLILPEQEQYHTGRIIDRRKEILKGGGNGLCNDNNDDNKDDDNNDVIDDGDDDDEEGSGSHKGEERWLHLVLFKSGVDDRARSISKWICLQEHRCLVGASVGSCMI